MDGQRIPHVDGLRGVAVLSVVLYHMHLGLAGGYAGVDVFFVLSGYLITTRIILNDGAWSAAAIFFARRLRRLIPALLLTLSGVTIVAAIFYTPNEFYEYGWRLLSAAAFVANFRLMFSSGYFDELGNTLELLHFWSLGVEEQWYFCAPFLFLGAHKWLPKVPALVWPVLVGFASFAFWIYCIYVRPGIGFYMMPPRLWEFMLGGAVALLPAVAIGDRYRQIASVFGLALIFGGIGLAEPADSASALVIGAVCLGTGLILLNTNSGGRSAVNTFLASQPLLFLGQISYALYLWHWPLLSMPAIILARPLTLDEKIGAVVVASIVAWLSTRFLEKPILARPLKAPVREIFRYLAMLAVVALLAVAIIQTRGFADRFSPEVLAAFAAQKDAKLFPSCIQKSEDACAKQEAQIIVWGDSHAEHWIPAINTDANGMNILRYGWPGCPPLPNVRMLIVPSGEQIGTPSNWDREATQRHCFEVNEQTLQTVETRKKLKTIVIGAAWQFYTQGIAQSAGEGRYLIESEKDVPSIALSRQVLSRSLRTLVTRLTEQGIHVILIGDNPEYMRSPTNCLARAMMFGWDHSACARPLAGGDALAWSNALLIDLDRLDGVDIFLPSESLCKGTLCILRYEEEYVYRDTDHLTSKAAIKLGAPLRKLVDGGFNFERGLQ